MQRDKRLASLDTVLLAKILDSVNRLAWSIAGDGNPPDSVADLLFERVKAPKDNEGFDSGEDFERARTNILATLQREE